jgi:Raf kinase inhibitor-like YbhB/YbcL family protein
MEDSDAPNGTWDHWVIFNIPASARGLPESIPANPTLPDGSTSGNNSWGRTGYGGPCPPSGTHRYFFKLYALDEMLAISAGATKGELEKAMVGHILAQGELMGTFTK